MKVKYKNKLQLLLMGKRLQEEANQKLSLICKNLRINKEIQFNKIYLVKIYLCRYIIINY